METIKGNIIFKLNKTFSLLSIPHPVHLVEESDKQIMFNEITRNISYDLSDNYQIVSQLQSHTNWMREMFWKLQLENRQGLLINPRYIFRDKELNATTSIQTEHLIIQVKLDNNDNPTTVYKKTSKILYKWFKEESKRINKKYKLKDIYPDDIQFITAQMLENEYKHLSPEEREIEIANEHLAVLLENSGKRLHSGKMHKIIPTYVFDVNRFREIIFFDEINSSIHNVAQIGILASGQILSDQLSLYNPSELKELNIFKTAIERNDKIMEININLTNLSMVLLQKGHISEVSPGSSDPEVKIIKDKYKVEVL